MKNIGFTVFTEEAAPAPTIPELLDGMNGNQKVAILDGFAEQVQPIDFRQWVKDQNTANGTSVDTRIKREVVKRLYEELINIKDYSAKLMRGQVVDTPAVPPDPEVEGDEGTPATYLPAPTSVTALRAAVAVEFQEIFSSGEITAAVNKMIAYSSPDKNGNFAYYKAGLTG